MAGAFCQRPFLANFGLGFGTWSDSHRSGSYCPGKVQKPTRGVKECYKKVTPRSAGLEDSWLGARAESHGRPAAEVYHQKISIEYHAFGSFSPTPVFNKTCQESRLRPRRARLNHDTKRSPMPSARGPFFATRLANTVGCAGLELFGLGLKQPRLYILGMWVLNRAK